MNVVLSFLKKLKGLKIAASTIEKDLEFSNGLLGKAAKGKTNLSPEKIKKLEDYVMSKTRHLVTPEEMANALGNHNATVFENAIKEKITTAELSDKTIFSDPGFDSMRNMMAKMDEVGQWNEPQAGSAVNVHLKKEDHYSTQPTSIIVRPDQPWIKLIEDYCKQAGIVPEDLIEFHKKHFSTITKKDVELWKKGGQWSREEAEREQSRGGALSNFMKSRQKDKNGMI